MILYCNLVQCLSPVLECIQHKFLAMRFIWNLLQCCPMISRWSTPESLVMTLKTKLPKSVLPHRKQLKFFSRIHD